MAHAFQIDTLAFSKKLRAAGADERLAEAIVEGITGADISELATKADIREVKAEIGEVKAELKAEIAGIRAEMKLLEQRMTIKLGTMMIAGMGGLLLLDRVISFLGTTPQ